MVKQMVNKQEAKIGILMLNTTFPRIKGDIGNEGTFDFKVRRKIVQAANSDNVVKRRDYDLLPYFIESALQLEREGVKAITTSCGFLARYQRQIAESLYIPFFSSSLILLNFLQLMIGPEKKIGILTARKASLTDEYFRMLGVSNRSAVIYGMENSHFYDIYVENRTELDVACAAQELIEKGREMIDTHPDIGVVLLECTNMSPYKQELYEALQKPVFDICSLVEYVNQCV